MRRSTAGANTQEWMTIRFKIRSGSPGKSFANIFRKSLLALIIDCRLDSGSVRLGGRLNLAWQVVDLWEKSPANYGDYSDYADYGAIIWSL